MFFEKRKQSAVSNQQSAISIQPEIPKSHQAV